MLAVMLVVRSRVMHYVWESPHKESTKICVSVCVCVHVLQPTKNFMVRGPQIKTFSSLGK